VPLLVLLVLLLLLLVVVVVAQRRQRRRRRRRRRKRRRRAAACAPRTPAGPGQVKPAQQLLYVSRFPTLFLRLPRPRIFEGLLERARSPVVG